VILKKRGRSTRTVPRTSATPKAAASTSPRSPPANDRRASVVRLTVARNSTVSIPSRRIRRKVSRNRPAATAPDGRAAIASTRDSMARFRPRAARHIQRTIVPTNSAPRSMSQPSQRSSSMPRVDRAQALARLAAMPAISPRKTARFSAGRPVLSR
jgi:hypothetical protein